MEERSCPCVGIDVRNWCSSGWKSFRCGRNYAEREYDEVEELNYPATQSNTSRWQALWRKIKKEKRRILYSSAPIHVPYDPYTYSQNFDQGSDWLEPDDLGRSFSARFASSSRFFHTMG
eukprot:TRINITY_DN3078_c0_g1_i1.p1 TRINITY_DN3078_c0_g1~~TRINITY_DN3078_c0_g1_i1.p1  ORF type:complete len:129 (-),score=2.20 TRINITY_DN3078_c0_g1_i1:44-400(-)